MTPLILASGSPVRRRLLAQAGFHFRVQPAAIQEPFFAGAPAADLAVVLAQGKALAVADQNPDAVVVGADQVLVLPNHKPAAAPADRSHARRQLLALQGRTHQLVSAAVVVHKNRQEVLVDVATLHMRPLSASQVEAALDWNEWPGCAGAYRFEGRGIRLIQSWSGDFFTVLGLPLLPLVQHLAALGF